MRTDAILLSLAGLAFFLPALGSRDLWQPLETRYATVAREMATTGDWLIPRINGEHYQDKPPLFFWLAAPLWKCGVGPQGVRVVSALAATATLLLLYALARLWFSRRAALLAAAVLATSPEYGWLGRFGELDATLTFLTTLSVYGWFAGGRKVSLFYLGIGAAVMVKGPPGVLVPVLAAAAGHLARVPPSLPRAPFHPLWGGLLAVLPVACWFIPAVVEAGPSYAHELIGKHMWGRVVGSWQHPQPFYFYVTEASLTFLPWLPLLIPASVRAWRRRREEPASALLLFWLALGLVAFSAVSGKRIAYILPLAPAFALLVARGVEALLVERERPERATAVIHIALLVVIAGAGVVFLAACALDLHALRKIPAGAVVAVSGALLLGLGVAGARLARRRRNLAAVWALVASMVVGFVARDWAFVRRDNEAKSPRPVAEALDRLLPPGTGEAGIYPARPAAELGAEQYAFSGAFNVYSERLYLTPLRDAEAVRAFLAAPGRRLVLTTRLHADALGLPPERVTTAGQVGKTEMVFLRGSG